MSKRLHQFRKLYSQVFFFNNIVKQILSLVLRKKINLLLIITLLFSQSVMAFVPADEWVLYKEINGVKIFTSKEECHDFANGTHYEYIVLKFVNTTSVTKTVTWSEHIYYNGVCNGCEGNTDRPIFQIELKTNETKQGGCGADTGDTFRIFSRFLNYTDKQVLTKFDLNNLIVIDR